MKIFAYFGKGIPSKMSKGGGWVGGQYWANLVNVFCERAPAWISILSSDFRLELLVSHFRTRPRQKFQLLCGAVIG